MLYVHKWTEILGNILLRGWKSTERFLEKESLLETKWGHRVMDQIFREGQFSIHRKNGSAPRRVD